MTPAAWLLPWLATAGLAEDRCTYTASVWHVAARRSSRIVVVDKDRAALVAAEQGPAGCTPCEQDQVTAQAPGGLELTLCRAVIEPVVAALGRAVAAGAVIERLEGHRPSVSRGPVSAAGERTALSNHAFGTAIDVNSHHNGLYTDCGAWSPGCRLLRGGPWTPGHPLALHASHPLVVELEALGWRWGGRLEGIQKDFMHFSLGGEQPALPWPEAEAGAR